jgi:hypothetical protein
MPYFLSSLLVYIFHRKTEEGKIDRKYVISRYWICWIVRVLSSKKQEIGNFNSQKTEKLCEDVIIKLADKNYSDNIFNEAISLFEKAKSVYNRKNGKTKNGDLVRLRAFKDEVRELLGKQVSQ